MAEVLYSWASISFARNDGSSSSPASASASAMAAAVAANGEGRTHGFDWNDGSLCSVSRSVGPLRERITSSPREIRREGQKTIRGGTRRRGSEVKWMSARRSAFVRSVWLWRSERNTPFYLVFFSTTVAYQECFISETCYLWNLWKLRFQTDKHFQEVTDRVIFNHLRKKHAYID